MDENKLSYRRIRNDVHIRLNNKEAATFLALMFYSDFNTGESHVIHKTLRDKTGIPESTLKKYLKELAEKGIRVNAMAGGIHAYRGKMTETY